MNWREAADSIANQYTEKNQVYKDRECITCKRLFDCIHGKKKGTRCLFYEEREE